MPKKQSAVLTRRDNQILARFRDGLSVGAGVPELALRFAVRKLAAKKEQLEDQIEELESRVNVPNFVRCTICKTPCVLRRAIFVGAGESGTQWVFQKDCKCRAFKPEPVEGP